MSVKRDRSDVPKSLVPDTARVPKLTQREPDWQRVPDIAPESALRAEARMKEVAERIRGGKISDLPKLGAPLVGTARRGLEHDNSEPCNHWLGTDRLKWFGLTAPASGPFSGTSEQALRDEFCSPLSTIVGATFL